MIEKKTVCQIVDEWLEDKEYFLVEVIISPDDKIVVEIDHKEGVWIEDCVELSRYIESRLNREDEDYELEVGSAGLEREFNRTWHFTDGIGTEVRARTIRPIDGEREFIGTLQSCKDDMLTLETETGSISLPLAALTFVKRYEAFEF